MRSHGSARDDTRLDELLRANSSDLLAYFARRVEIPADAADLLSELMIVVWKRQRSIPVSDPDARPWMFGIARNILRTHYRSARRKSAMTERLRLELTAVQVVAPTGPDAAERAEAVAAVAALPADLRELVTLVHWEGLSIVDAGAACGLNASTARSRYARARFLLRESLSESSERVTSR